MDLSPIAKAVEPLRASAIQRAAEYAEEHIVRIMKQLELCGWDLNKAFPSPHGRMGRVEYAMVAARRHCASSVTQWLTPSIRHGQPCLVERSEKGCVDFVEKARKDADATYSLFIQKLELKVGGHQQATLTGNHVWGYSILTIVADHETQFWKTQQILNVSKLGKVFNQWPTRRVRSAKI